MRRFVRAKTRLRKKLLGVSTSMPVRETIMRMPASPGSARIHALVGKRLAVTDNLMEARKFLFRAVQADENNDDWVYRLALVEQRLSNILSAQEFFGRAIDLNDLPKYRYHRSVTHILVGDIHRALADLFSAAGAKSPDDRVIPKLWSLITSKKISNVDRERYLAQGIELGIESRQWHLLLAQIAFQRHDLSSAANYFKIAIDKAQLSQDDTYNYALALNELGSSYEAGLLFDGLVEKLPKPERSFGIGALHAKKGNWSLAKSYFAQHVPDLESLPEFYYRVGMAYDRTYDWSGAEYYYTLAIIENGHKSYWQWRLAFVLERQGKYTQSAEYYFRSAELGAKQDGYYHSGRMHAAAGRESEAVASFRLARTLMTESAGKPARGGIAEQAHLPEDRLPPLEQAKIPQNAHLFRTAGIELVREARDSTALPYIWAATRSLPEHDPMVFYALGIALDRLGRTRSAVEAFLRMSPTQRPDGVGRSIELSHSENLRCRYVAYREELPIDAEAILYEVGHGSSISCNPLAVYKAAKASVENANFIHFWVVNSTTPIPDDLLEDSHVVIVERETDAYFRALATAKFLINNTSFGTYFIRRDGQRYLNTWHGTPWKTLGKSVKGESLAYGNITRNLMQVTHLAVGNHWTADILLKEHNVQEVFSGQVAVTGSPRNDVLQAPRNETEFSRFDSHQFDGEGPLVVYVPTWHGTLGEGGQIEYDAEADLKVLQTIESAGCRVVYSAHRFVYESALRAGMSNYLIPKDVDLYAVLKYADAIVTDHSSVFADFLVLDRPIVFYAPYIEQYQADRGLYSLDLPGALCKTVAELVVEIGAVVRRTDKYVEQRRVLASEFSSSEDGYAANRVLAWLMGNESDVDRLKLNSSNKPVLFRHSFIPNGIASSFRALSRGLRTQTSLTPHVLVDPASLLADPGRHEQLEMLADTALIIPRSGAMLRTKEEHWLERKDRSSFSALTREQRDVLMRGYKREYSRLFGDAGFAMSCEFDGYSTFWTRVMGSASSGTKRAIYMHNNMLEERTKKHPELYSVIPDYDNYDLLISVSESVNEENREQLSSRYELPATRFVWSDNAVDSERVFASACEPVCPEHASFINRAPRLVIAVGRLSQEKGHDRLLRSLAQRSNDLHLLVVGGGPELESLQSLTYHLGLEDRVCFTGQVLNPYPLMARADAVALLSRWEGQGLALLEAMLLQRPIVATDIPGPRSIVNTHGGTLVPNSDAGVALALDLIALDKLDVPTIDIDSYNRAALGKFIELVGVPILEGNEGVVS